MPAFTVHDCFATTPNNRDKMVEIVKQAFILIYFNDKGYLIKFHEHILNELNEMETYSIILKDNKYYLKNDLDESKNNLIAIPELPAEILINNDIIKRDVHVTSIITDKKFKLYCDNKRLINNKDPIIG